MSNWNNLSKKKNQSPKKYDPVEMNNFLQKLFHSISPLMPINTDLPENYINYYRRILSSSFSIFQKDESKILNMLFDKASEINHGNMDYIQRLQSLYSLLTKKRIPSNRWSILYLLLGLSKPKNETNNFAGTNELLNTILKMNSNQDDIEMINNLNFNKDSNNNINNQNIEKKNLSPIIVDSSKTTQLITEKEIINDLMFVFQGINGHYILYDVKKDSFILNQYIPFKEEIIDIIGELCELGWLYKNVSNYLTFFNQSNIPSQFIQSFTYAIQNELNEYYKLISFFKKKNNQNYLDNSAPNDLINENQNLNYKKIYSSNEDLTLKNLILWTKEPIERMRWLSLACESVYKLRGSSIVSQIFSYVYYSGGEIYLKSVLDEVLKPFFNFIKNWIQYGDLKDPYKEFFVDILDKINDDDLWNLKYQIIYKNIPNFLNKDLVIKIFEIGKCIHFIRNYCGENSYSLLKLKDILIKEIDNYYINKRKENEKESNMDLDFENENINNLQNFKYVLPEEYREKDNKFIDIKSYKSCLSFINYLFNEPPDRILIKYPEDKNEKEILEQNKNSQALIIPNNDNQLIQSQLNNNNFPNNNLINYNNNSNIINTNLQNPNNLNNIIPNNINNINNYNIQNNINNQNININQYENNEETDFLQSLINNIDLIHILINKEVINLIYSKFHFRENLDSINKYLLLGQGDMMQSLMESLFEELKKPALHIYKHNLQANLETAIRATNAQFNDKECLNKLNIKLLDVSTGDTGWDIFVLEYNVEVPLTVIFNKNLLKEYQKLFFFFWKIKRLEYSQDHQVWRKFMNFSRTFGNKYNRMRSVIQRAILFNQQVIHFINNLHNYLALEVLETQYKTIIEKIPKIKKLDELIELHKNFVENIISQCLLNQENSTLYKKIIKIFDLIMRFRTAFDVLTTSFYEFNYENRNNNNNDLINLNNNYTNEAANQISVLFENFKEQITDLINTIEYFGKGNLKYLAMKLDYNDYYSFLEKENENKQEQEMIDKINREEEDRKKYSNNNIDSENDGDEQYEKEESFNNNMNEDEFIENNNNNNNIDLENNDNENIDNNNNDDENINNDNDNDGDENNNNEDNEDDI